MVAALVGVAAGGLVGGLFAIPLLGATKAIYLSTRSADNDVAAGAAAEAEAGLS
jgi:predicted PurR-regulated permease PerM